MEKIGAYLKNIRTEKGLSLEDISSNTRLNLKQLQDIEKDDFSEIGKDGYGRIVLTTYAKALGTDLEKVLKMMGKESINSEIKPDEHLTRNLFPPIILLHKNFLLWMLLIVLTVILALTVKGLYQRQTVSYPFRTNNNSTSSKQEELITIEDTTVVNGIEAAEAVEIEVIEPIVEETATEIEPIILERKIDFSKDRTDYLKEVLAFNTGEFFSQNSNYIKKYISK